MWQFENNKFESNTIKHYKATKIQNVTNVKFTSLTIILNSGFDHYYFTFENNPAYKSLKDLKNSL